MINSLILDKVEYQELELIDNFFSPIIRNFKIYS